MATYRIHIDETDEIGRSFAKFLKSLGAERLSSVSDARGRSRTKVSDDPYFDNPANIRSIEEGIRQYQEGKVVKYDKDTFWK